jgi:hypothetical protein
MSSTSKSNQFRALTPPGQFTCQVDGFVAGQQIIVQKTAGPRLGGKRGKVLGIGATRTRIRIQLDSSKGPITLHARFLAQALA